MHILRIKNMTHTEKGPKVIGGDLMSQSAQMQTHTPKVATYSLQQNCYPPYPPFSCIHYTHTPQLIQRQPCMFRDKVLNADTKTATRDTPRISQHGISSFNLMSLCQCVAQLTQRSHVWLAQGKQEVGQAAVVAPSHASTHGLFYRWQRPSYIQLVTGEQEVSATVLAL